MQGLQRPSSAYAAGALLRATGYDAGVRRLLCSAALLALAGACDPPGLAYGSSEDIADILAAHGVTSRGLVCKNPRHEDGTIVRAVACATALTDDEVQTLRASVPLAPGPARDPAPHDNCSTLLKGAALDILVGENTRVTNGARAIQLYVDRATGAACVEIVYPWG